MDAPVMVRDLPAELPFAFLGRVLPTVESAELRLQFHRVPALEAGELAHRAAVNAQVELQTSAGMVGRRPAQLRRESETAEAVGEALAARQQDLWKVGVSFHGLGRTKARAERVRTRLLRSLEALGFRPVIPRYEIREASGPPDLLGTERRPREYWHLLPTDALATFFPLSDELVADPGGILLGLLLGDATPVILDRWAHASYSWGLFGATGSGKSFAAALWTLRSHWMRPNLDVVVLDPLGEFGTFVRRLGGSVVELRNDAVGRVNPLDPRTTAGNLEEKASRVATMLGALFPSLRDEESATLDATVRRQLSEGSPTFTALLEDLSGRPGTERLVQLLEIFRSGSLRHLNGPTTVSWEGSPLAIDFHGVPAHQMPFYLTFSMDALAVRLRARPGPKLVLVDEAHLLLRDPRTADFLERMVRLVRHYDAGFLLLSQNPDDFLWTESGRALVRNLRLSTFLRVAHVSADARAFYGLTDAEAEWLTRTRLPREAGYSEGLARAGTGHFPIAVVASTPEFEFLESSLGAAPSAAPERDAAPAVRL